MQQNCYSFCEIWDKKFAKVFKTDESNNISFDLEYSFLRFLKKEKEIIL